MLNVKTVLFQTIQFNISINLRFIWPIDSTLSGVTTADQSRPGSDDNKRVLRIPKSSGITGASPIRLFSVISKTLVGGVLPLWRDAVGVFCSPNRLGHVKVRIFSHSKQKLGTPLFPKNIFQMIILTDSNADSFSLKFERKQVSRTLLSIQADLNNAVVWMVSSCPLISKSSRNQSFRDYSMCINHNWYHRHPHIP